MTCSCRRRRRLLATLAVKLLPGHQTDLTSVKGATEEQKRGVECLFDAPTAVGDCGWESAKV